MNLPKLAIKRPVFITCIFILLLAVGGISMRRMPVDLFPDVTFPVVMVNTVYSGAGPEEIETLVTRPIEDQLSTISGMKTLRSINKEGVSTVIAEFTLDTDIQYAEQQVRDKMGLVKRQLPEDIEEPIIQRIDPADQPVLILAVNADLPPGELYDLADQTIRTSLEQVNNVGAVSVLGGRKREIRVELDREKLRAYEVSATQVANQLAQAGQNTPAGSIDQGTEKIVFRTLGEFTSVEEINSTIVSFVGNDVPVTVGQLGRVVDGVVDETSRVFTDGKQAVFLMVFRQSGSNTIEVVDSTLRKVGQLNAQLASAPGRPQIKAVRDGAKPIRANVADVEESILIGVILTILVVYLFLASWRSTVITGVALPNSLIGAFFLMSLAGFSINVMSLLALSLAVGLLIDDAIVVRENIFRHMENGSPSLRAAEEGTNEVLMAVIATTLSVVAVFGPIGFLDGVVGQFFKEFGLTVCFVMAISTLDALTMAPMLSAYFGGTVEVVRRGVLGRVMGAVLRWFSAAQDAAEEWYARALGFSLRHPMFVLGSAVVLFVGSLFVARLVPKTFVPAQDNGEFMVTLELPPETNLDQTAKLAREVDERIRSYREVDTSVMIIGNRDREANKAQFFVDLVPADERSLSTIEFKGRLREALKPYAHARPQVTDIQMMGGGGQRPFMLNVSGRDMAAVEQTAMAAFEKLKGHRGLTDVDISYRPGKPEFQFALNRERAQAFGVSASQVGQELRTQIEGSVPAVFREGGEEYDIRVRLREEQRDLQRGFPQTLVPNVNQRLIRLSDVAAPVEATGPATIDRQDRSRFIQISGDLAPDGPGLAAVMGDVQQMFQTEVPLPEGVSYRFVGQAESFQELIQNMLMAAALGILFIYLVLASLYESFVTPFTIMLVLPLAACGAFFALYVAGGSLDIFSMIGCIMLMGIATKNSILLVDYTNQLLAKGMERSRALIEAGRVRLRPILMTTFALIAGMLPVAIGLNEASKQRTSMGIAVIGGLISSTLLTLVVVPAAFSYIERFRAWMLSKFAWTLGATGPAEEPETEPVALPAPAAATSEIADREPRESVLPS